MVPRTRGRMPNNRHVRSSLCELLERFSHNNRRGCRIGLARFLQSVTGPERHRGVSPFYRVALCESHDVRGAVRFLHTPSSRTSRQVIDSCFASPVCAETHRRSAVRVGHRAGVVAEPQCVETGRLHSRPGLNCPQGIEHGPEGDIHSHTVSCQVGTSMGFWPSVIV